MLITIVLIIIAYSIGSFSSAVWIGKWFYGIDVRRYGSMNAGATNTLRVLGWKAGIPVLLLDALKGWIAVKLAAWLMPKPLGELQQELLLIACGIAAVLGHIFPLYSRFKGGKGVATLLGIGLALFPYPTLGAVVVFIIFMILSCIVSLSSILAGISFPFFVVFLPYQPRPHWPFLVLSILVAIFIPFTHLSNIRRLLKGEEKKFSIAKNAPRKEINLEK